MPKIEIRNIERGKGDRNHILYAFLYVNDELEISATLDYIYEQLNSERFLPTEKEPSEVEP